MCRSARLDVLDEVLMCGCDFATSFNTFMAQGRGAYVSNPGRKHEAHRYKPSKYWLIWGEQGDDLERLEDSFISTKGLVRYGCRLVSSS